MTDSTYLVKFANLDEAISAAVEQDAVDVLEMRPDGTCRPLNWDGEQPQKPTPETTPTGGSMFDPTLLQGLAASLAKQAYRYTGCNLQMPTHTPQPDQAES